MLQTVLDLLSNPSVVIAGTAGIVLLFGASKSRTGYVFACAVFAIAVSIVTPLLPYGQELIPLAFPLNSIRENNRFICVSFGTGLLLVGAIGHRIQRGWSLPISGIGLVILHTIILAKNLLGGPGPWLSFAYFFGTVIVIFVTWQLSGLGLDGADPAMSRFCVQTSLLLLGVTSYQFFVNPAAMFGLGARFNGLTANAQMYVLSAAPTIPVLLYIFFRYRTTPVQIGVVIGLTLTLYYCYLTGSRLSLVLLAVGWFAFFQLRLADTAKLVILAAVVLFLWSLLFPAPEVQSNSRFRTAGDTRTAVWSIQLAAFMEYPVFGVPLNGKRVGFGESSWLGAAESLGLIGLFPMMIIGFRMLKLTLYALESSQSRKGRHREAMCFAIATVSAVGSIFEASLFGALTIPAIMFMVTLFYLEHRSREDAYSQSTHSSSRIPITRVAIHRSIR